MNGSIEGRGLNGKPWTVRAQEKEDSDRDSIPGRRYVQSPYTNSTGLLISNLTRAALCTWKWSMPQQC